MSWRRFCLVIAISISICWSAPFVAAQGKDDKKVDAPQKPKPKFTVGKETTYVTGPIDKDGYIDYVAALNDKLREGVTPEKNAHALLWKAFGPRPDGESMPDAFFALMKIPVPPAQGDYFVFPGKKHFNFANEAASTRFYDTMDIVTARPWTAKEHPDFAEWLKSNEKPLAAIIEATRGTQYYYPLLPIKSKDGGFDGLLTSNMAGVQRCRALASALLARAMLRTTEGRIDDAWNDLLAVHRLGRQVGRGATLIEGLVGIALEARAGSADLAHIEHAKLNTRQLEDRLRDLQTLPPLPPLADAVNLGERFMFLDSVMLLDRTGGDLGLDPALKTGKFSSGIVNWDPALRNANQWYTRMNMVMRLKDRNLREKQLPQIENDTQALKQEITSAKGIASAFLIAKGTDEVLGKLIGANLMCLLTPALVKMTQSGDRTEQNERNLHLAFALAAYKSDNGRYPMKLDALAPKYLAAIPDDLFSGKALIYRPNDAGYLLYSVGSNGKDDGGQSADDQPRGDDLVVRMPLPKLRGQQ